MPSEKPRMMLTLNPETKSELDRFSAATGKPAATFVTEILDQSLPYIRQLADAAEAAKEKRAEALDMLMAPLAEQQVKAGQFALKFHRERIATARRKLDRVVAGAAPKSRRRAKAGRK